LVIQAGHCDNIDERWNLARKWRDVVPAPCKIVFELLNALFARLAQQWFREAFPDSAFVVQVGVEGYYRVLRPVEGTVQKLGYDMRTAKGPV